jgi:transcriptional regulator with XRE-family HTH domain
MDPPRRAGRESTVVKRRRRELASEAARRNREQLARVGGEVRAARKRRAWTQEQLGQRVGLSRSAISAIERGLGGGHTLDTWQRVAVGLETTLVVTLARTTFEPADAGHLRIQELVLRLGRRAGYQASFELPTRPSDPRRSADVGLRDDAHRRLTLVECWNTLGDVGGAARATSRKLAEAEELAIAVGDERPHRVAGCWVVRATAANRALVARYPEVFAARFPGSSAGWVRALTQGTEPPSEPGLVWCDVDATRLFAWRQRGRRTGGPGRPAGRPTRAADTSLQADDERAICTADASGTGR